MDTSKYDAVLVLDTTQNINEAYGDDRTFTGKGQIGRDESNSPYFWYDDPKLYASNAFGKLMQSELGSWRAGYSAKVTDFAKWVVVDVSHHNHITGRTASKTFLVVFNGGPTGNDKGGGLILTTANKWRTISGYSQAVSYIKALSGSLESETSKKL